MRTAYAGCDEGRQVKLSALVFSIQLISV